MIIYLKDCLQAGYCSKGVKEYLKRRNIDYKQFVKKGIDIQLVGIEEDIYIQKIVDIKNKKDK